VAQHLQPEVGCWSASQAYADRDETTRPLILGHLVRASTASVARYRRVLADNLPLAAP
jgi:hypothetical protein